MDQTTPDDNVRHTPVDVTCARSRIVSWLSCTLVLLVVVPPARTTETTPATTASEVRGITLSTHGDGRDWARSDAMESTLKAIRGVGANWVAIHPYAAIRDDGSVRFHPLDPDAPPDYITGPIQQAHAQGLKIMIKPHIAYWGSKFSWRGEIEFSDEAQWSRFFEDYTSWIVELASVAKGADAFVVGTELDRTLQHESKWREIIAAVRKQNPFPLTYAANWTDYDRVPFWDALDVIGIQAYFPLTDEPTTDESRIRAGWATVMQKLAQYSNTQNRSVVFTELGYSRSIDAPVTPWVGTIDGAIAEPIQQICMRAALEAIEAEPRVIGSFLWKWFPEPRPIGRNYRLATPEMMQLIREIWQEPLIAP